jgi:hypothetical protein
MPAHVVSEKENPPASGPYETEGHTNHCGFTGAVLAQEAEDIAPLNGERKPVNNHAAPVTLRQPFGL